MNEKYTIEEIIKMLEDSFLDSNKHFVYKEKTNSTTGFKALKEKTMYFWYIEGTEVMYDYQYKYAIDLKDTQANKEHEKHFIEEILKFFCVLKVHG